MTSLSSYFQEVNQYAIHDHIRGSMGLGLYVTSKLERQPETTIQWFSWTITTFVVGLCGVTESYSREFFQECSRPKYEDHPWFGVVIMLLSNVPGSLFDMIYHIVALAVNILRLIPDAILAGIATKKPLVGLQVFSERVTDILSNINQIMRNALRFIPLIGYPICWLFDRVQFGFLLLPGIRSVVAKIDNFVHRRASIKEDLDESPLSFYIRNISQDHGDRSLFIDETKYNIDNPEARDKVLERRQALFSLGWRISDHLLADAPTCTEEEFDALIAEIREGHETEIADYVPLHHLIDKKMEAQNTAFRETSRAILSCAERLPFRAGIDRLQKSTQLSGFISNVLMSLGRNSSLSEEECIEKYREFTNAIVLQCEKCSTLNDFYAMKDAILRLQEDAPRRPREN